MTVHFKQPRHEYHCMTFKLVHGLLGLLALEQDVQKRKHGWPKGSKNKKTLEREAAEALQ